MNYDNYYKTKAAEHQSGIIEQLLQLTRIVFDGDLVNKSARDHLVELRFAQRMHGFNLITEKGLATLLDLGLIHP